MRKVRHWPLFKYIVHVDIYSTNRNEECKQEQCESNSSDRESKKDTGKEPVEISALFAITKKKLFKIIK